MPPPQKLASLPREIIFEARRIGAYVRVAAICTATGTEAVVAGPAGARIAEVERVAAAKLARMLAFPR